MDFGRKKGKRYKRNMTDEETTYSIWFGPYTSDLMSVNGVPVLDLNVTHISLQMNTDLFQYQYSPLFLNELTYFKQEATYQKGAFSSSIWYWRAHYFNIVKRSYSV